MADIVILPPLNPRGVFDPTVVYNPNDQVTYFGVPYYCRIGTIVGQPIVPGSNPNTWQLLGTPGDPGVKGDRGDPGEQGGGGKQGAAGKDGTGYTPRGQWDPAVAYSAFDVVSYKNAAQIYAVMWFAIAGSTNVVPGSNAAVWGAGIKGDTGDVTQAALDANAAATASAAAALASKNAAGTSETNALASKNAAATSETNAGTSAAAALASKNAAGTSETNALASKNAAATSAANASTSETNALASKNAAATSAANAGTSETNAGTSAAAALASKNAAGTSEANALASKNAAATSAANASTSETNAAASATAAAGSAGASIGLNFQTPSVLAGATTLDATYIGKNVKYTGAAAAITSLTAAALPAGKALMITNSGTGTITLTAQGTDKFNYGSTAPASLIVLPGEWLILHGTGVANRIDIAAGSVLDALTRVRVNTLVDDGLSALQVGGSARFTGKVLSVNSENMLFNGSGELGNAGWTGTTFTGSRRVWGLAFGNTAILSAVADDVSQSIVSGPGLAVSLQAEINSAGVTAGVPFVNVEAFNAAGASLGNVATAGIALGQPWSFTSATGITPANTASLKVHKQCGGASVNVAIDGLIFRRIKLELGSLPSTYSDEASVNSSLNNVPTPLLANDAANKAFVDAVRIYANSLATGRNLLDNGDCIFAQRGTTLSLTTSGSYGGPDRWVATNGSGGGAFKQSSQQITINGVARACVSHNVDTANGGLSTTGYWSGLAQMVEGVRIVHVPGNPSMLAFWFQSSVNGNHSACIRMVSTNAYTFVALFNYAGNGLPQFITIPIPTMPAAAGAGLVGSTVAKCNVWIGALSAFATLMCPTASLGTWVANQQYISAQGCVNWGATAGAYIAATDLQWEPGTVATQYERQPLDRVMLACYRHFFRINVSASGGSGDYWTQPRWCDVNVLGTTDARGCYTLPAAMRALPSLTVTQGQIIMTSGTAGIGMTVSTISLSGNLLYLIANGTQSTWAAGTAVKLGMYNPSGNTILDFSADL